MSARERVCDVTAYHKRHEVRYRNHAAQTCNGIYPPDTAPSQEELAAAYAVARGWDLPLEERAERARRLSAGAPIIDRKVDRP